MSSLRAGQRVGPYEITGSLGAGGMGEVYRARDSRLVRDVAIKVLPADFARDAERLARFRREAQVLAALNDPHIAAIHGLEEADGVVALALELAEGEDLAQRLRRGPVPVDEAIAIARQIAEGLEAAHEKGIVHRDLKPANVKLTPDGRVKLLDFGLAKAWAGDGGVSPAEIAQSPTITNGTEEGVVLGTAAYMSPEQARGRPVDQRADMWAFGVLLWEMLTGRRLFAGETMSDTLAAVLRQEVPWTSLPAGLPAPLQRLLRRCLERDLRRRLPSAAAARLDLDEAAQPQAAERPPAPASRSPLLAVGILAAALLMLVGWLAVSRTVETTPAPTMRLAFEPPPGVAFQASQNDFVVVSPDGLHIVFTGVMPDGRRQLWLRPLHGLEARPLPDTEDALEPFWSPDSRHIAFGAVGRLKRLAIAGGRAETIAHAPRLVGGSWSTRDVILFVPDFNAAVLRVDASGGEARPVTQTDAAKGETGHRTPAFLPDGTHFLYTAGGSDKAQLYVASLEGTGATPLLTMGNGSVRYADPGWLLFVRDGALLAQRFDADRRVLQGDVLPVPTASAAEAMGAGTIPTQFSVSGTGILIWRRAYRPAYQLVWFDRAGRRLGELGPPIQVALPMSPRLSPDGTRVAIQNREPEPERRGAWVYDVQRGVSTRLSAELCQFPVWSPDGRRVAWVENRGGDLGIVQRAANGAGETELLLRSGAAAGGNTFPSDWSPDGRFLLYTTRGNRSRLDTWILPLSGERRPRPLLAGDSDEQASQVSPDGRWIAYRSDVSGTYEIYLQSFTPDGQAGGELIRVSESGGSQPRFRRDGRELVFVARDGRLMAVSLKPAGATLEVGTPQPLFATRLLPAGAGATYEYDMSADGQRFLMGTVLEGPGASPPKPTVVLNWPAELLARRAP
jgi:Tol biopolymer transport system component